ncbi:hypothetical protein PPH41_04715 [Burkholderia gladioli]|uniref:hypothetical protein n=1 Tax=Burkholderia gladioli TaxID=28095 RepID=UPI001917064E|nr:hypothetical protein [Burkholderia gladioli]MDC6127292.1 hypothetical protein [Burkholderia gladioli]
MATIDLKTITTRVATVTAVIGFVVVVQYAFRPWVVGVLSQHALDIVTHHSR